MVRNESDPDGPIIQRYLAGDKGSFNELISRYERYIYNVTYRMTGNATDAADLTQEIFIHLHKKVTSFRGDAAFSTWFYRLAVNYCKDWLRKESRRVSTFDIDEVAVSDGGTGPSQHYEQKELQELVQSVITTLPEDQRIAIILRDLQGYNYEDIASITGVPVGTVKSRLARARGKLAEKLAPIMELYGKINV
ncbi:MAG TPA: sigma-70 family RNA polymerase sigma factor [Anaerolineae bacterium]|jgi:RNA polymerase sigma-70 factor (ECF subfamily)|nr:sigma-70 family RNA polymerase sigma factor [Anaerolineae bacterium]